MKRDASNETRALQVRRQGVASKRPDEAGRRKFRFCFLILRRVSFSFRRIFEPIRPYFWSGSISRPFPSQLLPTYSPSEGSANLHLKLQACSYENEF